MAKDSAYNGTSMGFTAKPSDLGKSPGWHEGGKTGFLASPEKHSLLSSVFNLLKPSRKEVAMLGAAASAFALLSNADVRTDIVHSVDNFMHQPEVQEVLSNFKSTIPNVDGQKIGDATIKAPGFKFPGQ